MDMTEKTTPFGLIFEEVPPQPQMQITPVYDEEMDVSCIEDARGGRTPYVEFAGRLATETYTRVANEPTDNDEDKDHYRFVGTQTESKTWGETTDTDPEDDYVRLPASIGIRTVTLATDTFTRIQTEPTDTDPGDDHARFLDSVQVRGVDLATETFTAVKSESTDKD